MGSGGAGQVALISQVASVVQCLLPAAKALAVMHWAELGRGGGVD